MVDQYKLSAGNNIVVDHCFKVVQQILQMFTIIFSPTSARASIMVDVVYAMADR